MEEQQFYLFKQGKLCYYFHSIIALSFGKEINGYKEKGQ